MANNRHKPDHGEIRPGVFRLFHLALRRPDRARDEADDEIRLHLQLRAEQLVSQGFSPAAAREEAERRFGPLDEARERLHSSASRREERMRMREWLDNARQDLRFAVRGMRRKPAFTATAVLCLALGIGANAATFSLFDELLLRPLPVPQPERLVNLSSDGPKPGRDNWGAAGTTEALFSYPMYRDLARAQRVFTGIAVHKLFPGSVTVGGETQFVEGVIVSGSYFPTLGLRPAVGRLIAPSDDETIGAHPVAVLSHAYWTSTLGADPGIVGKPIVINGKSLTVVGVAPEGFEGTTLGRRPRVYVPLAMVPALDPTFGPPEGMEDRRYYWLYLFARLEPGVSIEQARSAMNALHTPILADVEAPLLKGTSDATLARFKARTLDIEPGSRGQSLLHGQTRTPLIFLFAITGLVVLIACANVANLMLARAATRVTEMAVRLSLGAGRRRLFTQLLVEACLLAFLGGVASLAVAWGALSVISSLIPPAELGTGASLSLELRTPAFVFAAVVALGTGLLFGLFPALHSTRADLITAIRANSGQPAGARSAARFRTSLVTAQIALSMALLIAAGLFIQSLRNIGRVDLGLDIENVVTFALAPALNVPDPARWMATFERVEEEIAAIPGVTSVAGSAVPLLTGGTRGNNVRVEGFHRDADTDANSRFNAVGPDYFETLRIPMLAGRDFTVADRMGAPRVAAVNETFAKKFGLGRDPIGRRMATGGENDEPLDIEIVGLFKDHSYSGVKTPPPPLFVVPYRQERMVPALIFYARTSRAPESVLGTVRETIARIDPNLPLATLKTMPQQVREGVYIDRMIGMLSAAFAALATLLAAVGLYGVLAYTVAQRTREIGVRMALGADAGRVRGMVMRQVGRMTVIGGAIGVAAAIGFGGAAQSLLFQLDGRDPRVIAAAAVVITIVALAAGYIPAWRASRVQPMQALRSE